MLFRALIPSVSTFFLVLALSAAVSASVRAETLLSSENFSEWSSSCWRCDIELEFDVIHGDVIRMSSDRVFGATLENRLERHAVYPELSWYWSLDPFLEPDTYFSLEVYLRSDDNRRRYMIRYVWNSDAAVGSVRELPGKEKAWEWVVTGKGAEPLRWHQVKRNLAEDLAALTGVRGGVDLSRIRVGLGTDDNRKLTASGYLSGITMKAQPEPQWQVVTHSSE